MQVPNRAPQLEAAITVFLVLSWITVTTRCYVRIFMLKRFRIDDYLMLITLGFYTIFGGLFWGSAHWGLGRHVADVAVPEQTNAFRLWFFASLSYVLTTVFLRLAVGYFLLQVALERRHRYIIYFLNTTNVIFNIAYFFFTIFACSPIRYFWTRVNEAHDGRCYNLASAYITIAQSALSVLLDWTYGILPAFIVKDLSLGLRKKILVAVILSLGALASTATIIRLPYLFAIVHHDDFLWYALPVGIWSYIEAGMGITAVSLATLRPVFQSVLVRLGVLTGSGTADRYRYNNAGPNPYQRSVGGSSTLKKAYMRYEDDVFSYDEELQLRGMTPMTRNSSQVEADSQRQPSRKAFSPEPRAENDGMKAWPVVDSDEKINTLMNEDDLAITRTTLDSTCSTINSPAKAFYVQKYPDRVP